jgi:hypothetical protein
MLMHGSRFAENPSGMTLYGYSRLLVSHRLVAISRA